MSEAVHTEVGGPGNLQKYEALNMKENVDPEGIEKETSDVKNWKKNQPFVSDGPLLFSSY